MISCQIDFNRPLRAVIYARVSTTRQNPRSPEQQIQTIRETMRRRGYHWTIVQVYRDNAISGRYTHRRQQLQQMLADLRSGRVQADVVLVDTFSRLSRSREANRIRDQISRAGAVVLTASSGFVDPSSMAGRAQGFLDEVLASQENLEKAHNVLRGKRDCVRRRHWAGGPPPLGYRLMTVMVDRNGSQEPDHRVPVPCPETRWIVEHIFSLADVQGMGTTRIARALNEDARIPLTLKPFHGVTVGRILDNPLYYGDYIWGQTCTDIIDDVRVREPVPEADWERISNYCEPLVPRDQWDRVQRLRDARRHRSRMAGSAKDEQSQIVGLRVPGIAIRYVLSGLVRCRHCGRSMTPCSSSIYETAAGDQRRYVAYGCPGVADAVCNNRCRIPEPWLRQVVSQLIVDRLFFGVERSATESDAASGPAGEVDGEGSRQPISGSTVNRDDLLSTPAFQQFVDQVREEFHRLIPDSAARQSALRREQAELQAQCEGWIRSLSSPAVSDALRQAINAKYEAADLRIRAISTEIASVESQRQSAEDVIDAARVADALQQLSEILASHNPSAANVMLAQHIEGIYCDREGLVVIRMCRVGALAGILDLIPPRDSAVVTDSPHDQTVYRATPRRRSKRDCGDAILDDEILDQVSEFAVDPERFGGLGPEWFIEDVVQYTRPLSWAQAHAREVAEYRLQTGATMDRTCEHFGRTVPTIRSALRHAKRQYGLHALGTAVSMTTRQNWSRDHAAEVQRFFRRPGATMKAAVQHFGRSDTTIRTALAMARESQPGKTN